MLSEKGKPLKLIVVRGGDIRIRGYSLMIKSKKLAKILRAIVYAKKSQKQLRLLQGFLILLHRLLTSNRSFRIAAGKSLN